MVKFILNPLTYCITSSNYIDPFFIGIGTSNPTKTLDVVGTFNVSGTIYNNGVPFSGGGGTGLWTSNGANIYYANSVGIGSSAPISILDLNRVRFYTHLNYGRISMNRALDNSPNIFIEGVGDFGTDSVRIRNNVMGMECGTSHIGFGSNNTFRVNVLGCIGIGTTQPSQKLHVQGNTYFSSNVGIGTFLPNAKVHLFSTSAIDNNYERGGLLVENTNSGSAGIVLQNLNTRVENKSWYIGTYNDSLNILYGNTSNDIRMSFLSSGCIGIGTTLPIKTLHIQGDASFKNDHLSYGSLITSNMVTLNASSNIVPSVSSAPHLTLNTTNQTAFITYLSRTVSTLSGGWWSSSSNPYYSQIAMTKASSETYIGGVLLPGGRVLFIPYTSSFLRVYDPRANTMITNTIPSGAALYSGGVVLNNGTVVMTPYTNVIGFYNPYNNVYSSNVYPQFNSADYRGGVLGTNGNVYFMPFNSATSIGVFNPTNGVFSKITTTTMPNNAYYGGVLIPDGRIVCIPHSATTILIINTSGTYSFVGTTPGNQAFAGGVLLPDGRVLFVPYNYSSIGFFNPITNVYSTVAITVSTGSVPYFRGGVLTADGRVVFSPYNSYNIGLYNIYTNTYSEIATGNAINSLFGTNVMLLDGRVLFVPYSSGITNSSIGILSGFPKLPVDLCYHPSFNKV